MFKFGLKIVVLLRRSSVNAREFKLFWREDGNSTAVTSSRAVTQQQLRNRTFYGKRTFGSFEPDEVAKKIMCNQFHGKKSIHKEDCNLQVQ